MLKKNIPQEQSEDIIDTVMCNDNFNKAHDPYNGLLLTGYRRQKFERQFCFNSTCTIAPQ
jgi:hypothetical protein